jgi:hypothetical protein
MAATNLGSDQDQLSSMAKQARKAMMLETLLVVADRGHFKKQRNPDLSPCRHHRLHGIRDRQESADSVEKVDFDFHGRKRRVRD